MTAPLGIHANYVTPPSDHREETGSPEPIRRLKWRLRTEAGRLLPKPDSAEAARWTAEGFPEETLGRVARCGRNVVGQQVTIMMGKGKARFHGLETCGSVWLCPVCSAKIAEHRRADIAAMLTAHVEGRRLRWDNWSTQWAQYQPFPVDAPKGCVYFGTFTIPHGAWDDLKGLRSDVADAWRRLLRGAPWDRACARWGITGTIRAMEVTHGRNGWHPHIHVLILAERAGDEAALRGWLAERWARILYRIGAADEDKAWDVFEHGVDLVEAHSVEEASGYVAKWGCDSELAAWHVKRARGKNRSPWDLLADAAEGDREAAMRWRQFAAAFTGSRHITMSHGLRDLYLDTRELTDAQIAAQDHGIDPAEIVAVTGETNVGTIRRGVWFRVFRAGLAVEVLEVAETGGWEAVHALLIDRGLALRREHWPTTG